MFKWSLSKDWNTHNIWRALYDLCHMVNVCVCLCNIKSHLSYMVIISSAFQQYFFLLLSCFSHVQLFERQLTIAYQATLSMEFFQQEYRSGLPWPPPGYLSNPGIEPTSPALQVDSLLPSQWGSQQYWIEANYFLRRIWVKVRTSVLAFYILYYLQYLKFATEIGDFTK